MENDLHDQLKNAVDCINQLQYLISVTTCIRERYYYNELLSYYYHIYHQLMSIENKKNEESKHEEQ